MRCVFNYFEAVLGFEGRDGSHVTGAPCEMYHNDLRIKFEFDPMGLTNKQKGIMALTTQPTF